MLVRDIIDYITTYSALGLKAKFLTASIQNFLTIILEFLSDSLIKRIQDFSFFLQLKEASAKRTVLVILWGGVNFSLKILLQSIH